MSEFIGLGYYVEVPAVICDIQRVGPSTGLPTRTAQGDILKNAVAVSRRHEAPGVCFHPLPKSASRSPQDSVRSRRTFSNARVHQLRPRSRHEQLDVRSRSPIRRSRWNRGKVLSAEDLDRLGGFARYKDVDGDGIGYRTVPGTNHPAAACFARGSGHNEKARYSEREDDYVNNVDRLAAQVRYDALARAEAARFMPSAERREIGIVCCGTSRYACEESRDQLAAEYGIAASYLRLHAYPFTDRT